MFKKFLSSLLCFVLLFSFFAKAFATTPIFSGTVDDKFDLSVSSELDFPFAQELRELRKCASVVNGYFVFDIDRARKLGLPDFIVDAEKIGLERLNKMARNGEIILDNFSTDPASSYITETGVCINGICYTAEQFTQLLDTAIELKKETPSKGKVTTCSSIALIAGTWCIPGLGEVIVTVAGTFVYDVAVNWLEKRQFNESAERAIKNCNSDRQNHIMNNKHNWNKFNKNPKWANVAPILTKVLKEGSEKWENDNVYIRTLIYKGETVVIRFTKDANVLIEHIGTAWCK